MACIVDLMYADYEEKMEIEEQEKEREKDDAPSPYSSDYSSSSSPSHHSDEEINQSIQAKNVELRRLLQKEKEEKQRLQLQLRAMEEASEKLQHNEGLVKPSSPISELTIEVNNVCISSVSFSHDTIYVGNMEVSISGSDMRILTKMWYKGG